MMILVLGLVLWMTVHLFPSVAPAQRQQLIDRLGENAYKGVFSLLIILSIVLMVLGWRTTLPAYVYLPAAPLALPAMLLVVLGLVLVVAANFPSRIKKLIRHPQLSGVLLWALAHLMLNGDSRSVMLFSALGAWCVISMLTTNKREGAWIKPEPSGWGTEILIVVIAVLVSALLMHFHSYLSGVPLAV